MTFPFAGSFSLAVTLTAMVNCARPRKIRPENGGDQRGTPHAVADHFPKKAFRRVFRVHVSGIDVAGHDGKQRDVLLGERALDRCIVTDLDFIEQAIFDKAHTRIRCCLRKSAGVALGIAET
jgi:hypothetical protein